MEASEADKVEIIACPECDIIGNHKGTCKWSFMRTGKYWIFVAKAFEVKVSVN